MPIGLAGDSQASPISLQSTNSTNDQVSGSLVELISNGVVNQSGTIDRLRGDITGRFPTGDYDVLTHMLVELRTLTAVMVEGLGVQTDPDAYRYDPGLDLPTN